MSMTRPKLKLPKTTELADFLRSGLSVDDLARLYNVRKAIIFERLGDAGYSAEGRPIDYGNSYPHNDLTPSAGGSARCILGQDNPTVIPYKPVEYRFEVKPKPRGFDWGELGSPPAGHVRNYGRFRAGHPGECGICPDPIDVGDLVCYRDQRLVHEDCDPEIMADL